MKNGTSLLYWLPRTLCIAAILFVASFSADAFTNGQSLFNIFMHFVPALFLSAMLLLAWRWEKAGGIAFLTIALGLAPLIYNMNHGRNNFSVAQSLLTVAIINLPFVLVGVLFIMSHMARNKIITGRS